MDYGTTYNPSSDEAAQLLGGVGIISAIISIVVLIVMLWIWARIFHKAGYSGWLSLLFLVPIVNFFIIFWFAFAKWPVELRAAMAPAPAAYYPPQQPGYAPPQGYQPPPGGYAPPPPPQQPPGGYPPQG